MAIRLPGVARMLPGYEECVDYRMPCYKRGGAPGPGNRSLTVELAGKRLCNPLQTRNPVTEPRPLGSDRSD